MSWGKRTAWLLFAVTLLRFVLNALVGLGDGEAYYWAWSQHLSLSYFDHPPAIAYLIAATTAIFGDNPFGVRFGTTLLFDVAAVFLFLLARRISGSGRAGFLAVAILAVTPSFGLAGGSAVPDVPLGAAWCAVLYFAWRVVEGAPRSLWLAVGALVGVAFLSKYVALLLAPVLVWVVARRDGRPALKTAWPYAAAIVAFACALPVVLWNVETGWATLQYHGGRHLNAGLSFANLGRLIGGQLLYVGPVGFAALLVVAASLLRDAGRTRAPGASFLTLASVPPLAILFFFVAWTPRAEPHWPSIGYLALMVGLAARYDEWNRAFGIRRWFRVARAFFWGFPISVILVAYVHLLSPALVFVIPDGAYNAKWDLANETRDWNLAADRAVEAAASARPAFVTAYHYTLCGQLELALKRRAAFACMSERRDAFSYWTRDDDWLGQNAVFVSDWRYGRPPDEILRCDRIETLPSIETVWGGKKAREFRFAICHGFRGRVAPPGVLR